MRTAIQFHGAVKLLHGASVLRVENLKIYERESVAFYGLSQDCVEILVNEMTGTFLPDEGSVSILGTSSREIADERIWFRFIQNIGIYNTQPVFQESSSIGENVAMLYRARDGSLNEHKLSSEVLWLANLVQLTITDLSKMMGDATPFQRMKVRLSRALAYRPKIVILCDPAAGLTTPVSQQLVDLVKRAKRKLRFTLILFTSDVRILQQLADRVLFLNPGNGFSIENQLRGWYHKLFPFVDPSPSQLLQLNRNVLHYGRTRRAAVQNIEKR